MSRVFASVFIVTLLGNAVAGRAEWPSGREVVEMRARPFRLEQVRLLDGFFKESVDRNRRYLHELESDRLLHMFRVTAGLPSSAKPLGGWESPSHGVRGHFMGHYLSACALAYAATGDEELKAKADALVAELAKCQAALKTGCLRAFPEEFFDLQHKKPEGVWCPPWYVYHKIMAGMIDMYVHCDNRQALEVAESMAAWTKKRIGHFSARQMEENILVDEFGGMGEVLLNLYGVTGNRDYLALGRRFDHEVVFDSLAQRRDLLDKLSSRFKHGHLHANTNIPRIVGAARAYELTGLQRYRDIAEFFWRQIVDARSYCTGGTSNCELWRTGPRELAGELSNQTQECCCTYNMLKLTRHLFAWSAEPQAADYYERALYNSVLSAQNPEDGMLSYYLPLVSGGWKQFCTPRDDFWCCTGTGIESFAKLGDSIYFHGDDCLFVNLFIASELNWAQKGLRVRQETDFPSQSATTLVLSAKQPVELALRIRVPYWAKRGATVKINGKPYEADARPSSYLTLRRTWKDGDRVEVAMPMGLYVHAMPDNKNLQAIMYGPLVLVGELGAKGLTRQMMYGRGGGPESQPADAPRFVVDSDDLNTWIKPVASKPLTFRTAGQPRDFSLVPLYRLFGQRYAVYWQVERKVNGTPKQQYP